MDVEKIHSGRNSGSLREENSKTDPCEATSDLGVLPVLSQRQKTGDLHQADLCKTQGATLEGVVVSPEYPCLPGTCSA